MQPTPKQISYAMALLNKAGFDTRYMNASFKRLGATMRQRSGTVEGWLRSMNRVEVCNLIDRLLKMTSQTEDVA